MTGQSVRKPGSLRKSKEPKKPHPDYPLTPHASGVFCKKVKGKVYYFPADPDAALKEWNKIKDDLLEGRDPRTELPGQTVGWLCNAFMDSRQLRVDAGELAQRSLDDYFKTCERMIASFGKRRRLEKLQPEDFTGLKREMVERWSSPVTVKNEIGRVNVVLKYAYDRHAVDRPIRTGPDFSRPSKKTLRLHRKSQPKKEFTAEQLHSIMIVASVHVKAMTFLGLNCAYNNTDCGLLEIGMVDFERGWLCEHRKKTAIDRDAWLWPETLEALRASLEKRTDPKNIDHIDRFFITKYGNDWKPQQPDNPLSKEFKRCTDKLKISRKGVNFGALRHCFETIGGNSRDQVAVDRVMGHRGRKGDEISSEYRESIDPQRIIDVCEFVRQWWLAGAPDEDKGGEA